MLRADDDLIEAIAERVERRLARSSRMQAQKGSPLGPRTHRAAVNRRLRSGEGGAAIVGEKFLLTQDALQEELDAHTRQQLGQRKRYSPDDPAHHRKAGERRRPRKASDQSPELDALQREITGGLRRIGEVR
jgi:hypothetical protein